MRLGFAVKVLGDGGLPSHDARRWHSGPRLVVSLGCLERILEYCDRTRRLAAAELEVQAEVMDRMGLGPEAVVVLHVGADLIDPIAFERFLRDAAGGHDFDVMLEAKAKDLALLRLRELVPVHLWRTDRARRLRARRCGLSLES